MEGANSPETLVVIKMRCYLVCFSPEGYNLPLEYTKLAAEFSQSRKNRNAVWICKPIGQSQGRGIFLFKVSTRTVVYRTQRLKDELYASILLVRVRHLIIFFFFSTHMPCIVIFSKFFIHQLRHKRIFLKTILKCTLKLTLKQLRRVSMQSLSSGRALLELTKVTVVLTTLSLAISNNALPDDGDCTETRRSCLNVNCNVNFKIFLKKIHLCISWWIKSFI
jgi:hypothetical protein